MRYDNNMYDCDDKMFIVCANDMAPIDVAIDVSSLARICGVSLQTMTRALRQATAIQVAVGCEVGGKVVVAASIDDYIACHGDVAKLLEKYVARPGAPTTKKDEAK